MILIIIVISVVVLVQYLDLDLQIIPNLDPNPPKVPPFLEKESKTVVISFSSFRDQKEGTYFVNIDGSNETKLIENKGSYHDWFPDGESIVYFDGINLEGAGMHIYTWNIKENKVIQLTHDKSTMDRFPSISPDGEKIVFDSAPLKGSEAGQSDIYLMNKDGSDLTKLTENGGSEPAWSPDGEKIVYFFKYLEIRIMDKDGSHQKKLTEGIQPDWSPDGKKIVFVSSQWPRRIGVINVDGSGLVWLTDPPEIILPDGRVTNVKDVNPKWSPDGKKIAFVSTRNGNWDIYVMNANGSNMTRLTDHPSHDQFPTWSPP